MYKSIITLINGTRIIGYHTTKEEAEKVINNNNNSQVKNKKIKHIDK